MNKDTWDQDVIDLAKKDFMVSDADKLVLDTLEVSYSATRVNKIHCFQSLKHDVDKVMGYLKYYTPF